MKLDKKTKSKIDKWFADRTPEEVEYISEKYLGKPKITKDEFYSLEYIIDGLKDVESGSVEKQRHLDELESIKNKLKDDK